MEFTSAEAEGRYAELVAAAGSVRRRARLRRHALADRRRPGRGPHPPRRPRRCWSTSPTVVARDRGDHRPPGPAGAGARGSWTRSAPDIGDAGKRALRLRPVRQRAVVLDPAPRGLARGRRAGLSALPARAARGCCAGADAADAYVEEKGLAVAVHTRRLARPGRGAFDRLDAAAARAGRAARPGGRAGPQRDRGALAGHGQGPRSSARWSTELDAGGFLFAGDDLGDLEAFEAVAELREHGLAHAAGLLGLRRGERPGRARRRGRQGPRGRPRPAARAHPRAPADADRATRIHHARTGGRMVRRAA